MTEQELAKVEMQVKMLGIAEAFTPQLAEQMKNAVPQIQQQFSKKYEDGEASAVLHWKKSDSSNLYFLNKFDQTVNKESLNPITRTFYINNFNARRDLDPQKAERYYTNFTFKSSYNYLAGRPVLNTYQNQNGQSYTSWDVARMKEGKLEEKHYHQNYGYDLSKILAHYSIRDVAIPAQKERLLQSLQRGNLQLATFLDKDGKPTKLYVSPNIPLGSLNVYDDSKTRIATQQLVEHGYIGAELANKLRQGIPNLSQKGEKLKEEKDISQTVSNDKKLKQALPGNDSTVRKTHRQKKKLE